MGLFKRFLRDNWFYFLLLLLFAIAGGFYLIQYQRTDASFFFNSNRTDFFNAFFKITTRLGEEPMYFIIGIALLFYRLRSSLIVAVTGLLVMGISFSTKAYFAVDRPIAFFRKQELLEGLNFVDGVNLHTGATSFPSGHTMSAFALYAVLTFMIAGNCKKSLTFILFLIALTVGISRIYLLQHFFEDVYAGAFIGVIIAMAVYLFQARYILNPGKKMDRPLIKTKWKRVESA